MPKTSFPNQTTDPFKRSKSNRPGQNGNGCPVCGHSGAGSWLQAPDRFHGRLELFELFRCPSCSLVWLHDPPPPSDIGRHYGADYDRTITSGGADPEHWNWRRDELLRHKSSGAILDLGCSSGGFLASFRSPSWKLLGTSLTLPFGPKPLMPSPVSTCSSTFTNRGRCSNTWKQVMASKVSGRKG